MQSADFSNGRVEIDRGWDMLTQEGGGMGKLGLNSAAAIFATKYATVKRLMDGRSPTSQPKPINHKVLTKLYRW